MNLLRELLHGSLNNYVQFTDIGFILASQPTKTTSTVGNFGPVVSSSATGMSSSAADKYAALSDLDSIFKEQTTTPIGGAQQGSLYGNTSNSSTSLGTPGNSTGASVMSTGPNPFASVGSTAPSFSSPIHFKYLLVLRCSRMAFLQTVDFLQHHLLLHTR